MGLTWSNAALLAKAKRNGVCFDKVLTIGHQELCLTTNQIMFLGKYLRISSGYEDIEHEKYIDNFLKIFFEAKEVCSIDYSDYQESSIIHDMNYPISSAYYEKFDVIIDGGSLEHIFNFPVAIENCMKMLKEGGNIFIIVPANNHMGHGFYQFSPELFFRIFQQENGFSICNIILEKHSFPGLELSLHTEQYAVTDPQHIKKRVGLVSHSPVMMMIHAVKNKNKDIFSKYPIQSDYAAIYKQNNNSRVENPDYLSYHIKILRYFYRKLPLCIKNKLLGLRQLFMYSFFNKNFYRKYKSL